MPSALFRVVVVAVSVLVVALVVLSLLQLAIEAWNSYGLRVDDWVSTIFGQAPIRRATFNTAILVVVACTLATLVATVLAWLNEGTEASLGMAGSLIPVVPFLMPALALPLGWVFVAAPNAGILNVLIRKVFGVVGIEITNGPLNIYSWPGMIFLYTIVLTGFAYLIMSSAIRNVDTNILEAARLAGARPVKVFRTILLPSIKSSFVSAFLLCLIPALAMYTVPVVIGPRANIDVLPVTIVGMVKGLYPPHYDRAFMVGMLLLIPILIASVIARKSGRGPGQAMLSTTRGSRSLMRLSPGERRVGRAILLTYTTLAVILPVLGLVWVSGRKFWSASLTGGWSPISNLQMIRDDSTTFHGIVNSIIIGGIGCLVIMLVAQILAFGQRLFPRFGGVIDGFSKSPAGVSHILLAMGILLTFAGSPFFLSGTFWILFIGFFIAFLPFASVVANAGLFQIGRDVVEASQVSGASELRTFRKIVRPLTRSNFAAGCVLIFILIVGDVNMSLLLSTTQRPTIGFVMLDLQVDSAFPQVATYALIVTVVNVVVTVLAFFLLGLRRRRA